MQMQHSQIMHSTGIDDAYRGLEQDLQVAVAHITGSGCPPRLAQAIRDAVFPGGARLRPRLVLAVASASGAEPSPLARASAVALELIHCGSLVHDDLPCFDDAATRRGQATIHRRYGEAIATLVGDGLIVGAFGVIAQAQGPSGPKGHALVELAAAAGCRGGIVAGQAWESEPEALLHIDIDAYHGAKTGSLFEAACVMGALGACAPSHEAAWRAVGRRIGAAYQLADDIADEVGDEALLGKPTGQDVAHARPSWVQELGVVGAVRRLEALLAEAVAAIPPSVDRAPLAALLEALATRLIPEGARHHVLAKRQDSGERGAAQAAVGG